MTAIQYVGVATRGQWIPLMMKLKTPSRAEEDNEQRN
jgi:hypothetical protein